jgi:hypothetical protein
MCRPSVYIKEQDAEDKPGIVQMTFEHEWEPPARVLKPLRK